MNPKQILAFPTGAFGSHGMTALDYFAGEALSGLADRLKVPPTPAAEVVADAYSLAQAMMVERQNYVAPSTKRHAFPTPSDAGAGLTMFDYFAGRALRGLADRLGKAGKNEDDIAEEAYALAEAMMAERGT